MTLKHVVHIPKAWDLQYRIMGKYANNFDGEIATKKIACLMY